MAKEFVPFDGSVAAILGGGIYSIQLDTGPKIHARLCGKMKKFKIRVILGDRVTVGVSPYDRTHGLILQRQKSGQSSLPLQK